MIRILSLAAALSLAACAGDNAPNTVPPAPGEIDCNTPNAPASQCEPETR